MAVGGKKRGQGRVVRGILHPAWGPLVRVHLHNPEHTRGHPGLAVLDTGASQSAVDQATALTLGLPSPGAATWFAVHEEEGRSVSPLRHGLLNIAGDSRVWDLQLIEVPRLAERVSGYDIVALLGWDVLGDCRLNLDGPAGSFALEIPRVSAGRRR